MGVMTELLDYAIETVRRLPSQVQDDLARTLLQLAGGQAPVYRLSAEERADLAEADKEIARGDLASEAEVKALWAKPIP
jgi:hypothetical protein